MQHSDKRREKRLRLLKPATVRTAAPRAGHPCFVRDISPGGCHLVGETLDRVSGEFLLVLEELDMPVACAVAWRRRKQIGAHFAARLSLADLHRVIHGAPD